MRRATHDGKTGYTFLSRQSDREAPVGGRCRVFCQETSCWKARSPTNPQQGQARPCAVLLSSWSDMHMVMTWLQVTRMVSVQHGTGGLKRAATVVGHERPPGAVRSIGSDDWRRRHQKPPDRRPNRRSTQFCSSNADGVSKGTGWGSRPLLRGPIRGILKVR